MRNPICSALMEEFPPASARRAPGERTLAVFWFIWAWLIPLLFLGGYALAYTHSRDENGVFIQWDGDPKYYLAGNSQNNSGVSADLLRQAAVRGLQRWQEASSHTIDFEYWQGTNNSDYEPNGEYNGLNSLYFATHAGEALDPGLIALTQTWYNTSSGQILEADIVLNDQYYQFTGNPTDTVGTGNGGPTGRVYIENVMTHELGHAFGMGHSPNLQATMLYMESPDQATLSCDDWIGIRAHYGAPQSSQTGAISGRVKSPSGSNLFGANVQAISLARGVVMATAVTDENGQFVIQSLEKGSYALMIEPVYGGGAALTDYFSDINTRVCSGNHFGRTFITQSDDFTMKLYTVNYGSNIQTGNLTVRCSASAGAALNGSVAGGSIASAADVDWSGSQFSLVDLRPNSGSYQYYRLGQISGDLEVNVNAYSAYSPVETQLTLVHANGSEVAGLIKTAPTTVSESGYRNFDARILAQGLASATYYLRIYTTSLSTLYFPAGAINLDQKPFFVMSGRRNPSEPDLADVIPDHPTCRSSENFAAYQSPAGKPQRYVVEDNGAGFCGQIQKIEEKHFGAGPRLRQTHWVTVLSWALPFGVIFGFYILLHLQRTLRRRWFFRSVKSEQSVMIGT